MILSTKCEYCLKICANNKGLSYHLSQIHSIKFVDYVLKYQYNGVWPLCHCGCRQKVNFIHGKFMSFLRGHQRIGIPRSLETRVKISKSQLGKKLSNKTKLKIQQAIQKGYDTGTRTAEPQRASLVGISKSKTHREKIGKTRKARIESGEIVINSEKISKTITRIYTEDGGFQWAKGSFLSSKTNKTIYYRSSWELALAKQLDTDVAVKTWDYESIVLYYELNEETKRYVPDFHIEWIDGYHSLVEVKPSKLRNNPKNILKRESATKFCEESGWDYCEWEI